MSTPRDHVFDVVQSVVAGLLCGVAATAVVGFLVSETDWFPAKLQGVALTAAFVSFAAVAGRLHWKSESRRRDLVTHRRCARCGYDLSHSECRCPECGTFVPLPLEKNAGSSMRH